MNSLAISTMPSAVGSGAVAGAVVECGGESQPVEQGLDVSARDGGQFAPAHHGEIETQPIHRDAVDGARVGQHLREQDRGDVIGGLLEAGQQVGNVPRFGDDRVDVDIAVGIRLVPAVATAEERGAESRQTLEFAGDAIDQRGLVHVAGVRVSLGASPRRSGSSCRTYRRTRR